MTHRSTRESFGRLVGGKGKKGQFHSGIYVGEMWKIDPNSQHYQSLCLLIYFGDAAVLHSTDYDCGTHGIRNGKFRPTDRQ